MVDAGQELEADGQLGGVTEPLRLGAQLGDVAGQFAGLAEPQPGVEERRG